MCTLTFIPLKDEIIFTSNRDEHVSRAQTRFPVVEEHNGSKVYFPQDPKAGGTWLASSDSQRISVLLNGAFEAHKYRPPYRKSRGIVLLETFDYSSLADFITVYTFDDLEPFTIVSYDINRADEIEELRWDGTTTHFRKLSSEEAHIWSSSQLYKKEIRDMREAWFSEFLAKHPNAKKMIHFHEFGGNTDKINKLKIDRGNGLQTISISQLIFLKEKTNFNYRNLVSGKTNDIIINKK